MNSKYAKLACTGLGFGGLVTGESDRIDFVLFFCVIRAHKTVFHLHGQVRKAFFDTHALLGRRFEELDAELFGKRDAFFSAHPLFGVTQCQLVQCR